MSKVKAKIEQKETQEEYRQRIVDLVCTLMAEGQSLRRICMSVEEVPHQSTICHWIAENTELAKQYARAREMLTDVRFDEFRDAASEIVARYISEGWEPKDAISMAKLETSNMQWEISKLNPKKYGDKIEAVVINKDYNIEMTVKRSGTELIK